ncbi:COQ9 family protein [Hyphococcus flavus]|uniref:COQ9 family protein n=1 Tax=Hyphococcus flavus TaxID=1866326 RepID=A0AAE9ZJ71_9PROT|nr:COQ9 family protein [Hyphococcus flavus]WDI31440.1 COQ9 family protein [Hyphococcus flavus]
MQTPEALGPIPKALAIVYNHRAHRKPVKMPHTQSPKKPETPLQSPDGDGFEAARQAILAEILSRAPFDGWTDGALSAAARDAGFDRSVQKAAFPEGVRSALKFWSAMTDQEMSERMRAPEFSGLKIREKVAFAVSARLDILRSHKEAARRAAATLALPHYAPLAANLSWSTADTIWRGLGDKSTDFNYYSKRGILTGVWTCTFARWLADDSEEENATRAFLDARIENVMQIEKAKAKIRGLNIDPKKPIEWLARMRYPAGGSSSS